jgi:hypothetical protein
MKRLTCKVPENIFIFGFLDELAESGGYSVSSVDGFSGRIFRMKRRLVLLTAVTCAEGAEIISTRTLGIMMLSITIKMPQSSF